MVMKGMKTDYTIIQKHSKRKKDKNQKKHVLTNILKDTCTPKILEDTSLKDSLFL